MCEWFDETCGELLTAIDDKNLREKTLVIYVCDNGWIQDPSSKRYAPRSKQTPYEGGIRTPIIYSWPGEIAPGRRAELETSIDIFPTVLAAAGATLPNGLPGLNLMPNLISRKKVEREQIFGESFAHDIADVEDPEASLLYRWVIEGPWKLLLTYDGETHRYASTHPRTEKGPQLFHLLDDPQETKNVAEEYPETVSRLAAAIHDGLPTRSANLATAPLSHKRKYPVVAHRTP